MSVWAIRKFQPLLPTVDLSGLDLTGMVRKLAQAIADETHSADTIAGWVIRSFELSDPILSNIRKVCQLCRYLELSEEQTLNLCYRSGLPTSCRQLVIEGLKEAIGE